MGRRPNVGLYSAEAGETLELAGAVLVGKRNGIKLFCSPLVSSLHDGVVSDVAALAAPTGFFFLMANNT